MVTTTVDEDVSDLALGTRIRTIRRARRLTLRELSDRAGVTESFLSQVEREVATPSIATVRRIARALDLTIAELFAEEPASGRVVRREARRRIAYPGLGAVDEFLTAGISGKLQVIISTIDPGGGTGPEPYAHDSDEEVVVVLAGLRHLWVADEHDARRQGHALTFRPRSPPSTMLRGDTAAPVLFCLTPPSFCPLAV